jgi:hypothetical protein
MRKKKFILSLAVVSGLISLMFFFYAAKVQETRSTVDALPMPQSSAETSSAKPCEHARPAVPRVEELGDRMEPADPRFAEIGKIISEFEKKPLLTGTLTNNGQTYTFQYRRFDKPLDLLIPYHCPYILNRSALYSELSATSLYHNKDNKSPDILQKWKDTHSPECQEQITDVIKRCTKIYNVPISDYLPLLKNKVETYEILGEVRYNDCYIVVRKMVTKSKKLCFIHGIIYKKDVYGKYLCDIKYFGNDIVLRCLSQDQYSIITDASKGKQEGKE